MVGCLLTLSFLLAKGGGPIQGGLPSCGCHSHPLPVPVGRGGGGGGTGALVFVVAASINLKRGNGWGGAVQTGRHTKKNYNWEAGVGRWGGKTGNGAGSLGHPPRYPSIVSFFCSVRGFKTVGRRDRERGVMGDMPIY